MWIAGKAKEMEDISLCFRQFPQFHEDYPALLAEGVIKRIAFDRYEWTKSKTSLAEYFKWVGEKEKNVPNGFWDTVETVFGVDRKRLSHLASRYSAENAGRTKPKHSRDFKKIMEFVLRYRESIKRQEEQERKDREIFAAIKTFIDEADGKDIKEIREAIEKTKTVLM